MQHWPDMGYVHRQEILHSLKMFLRICFAVQLRGGSRAAATAKMERFMIIVNGFQPLAIITKRSISDVATALDPPLQLPSKVTRQDHCRKFLSLDDLVIEPYVNILNFLKLFYHLKFTHITNLVYLICQKTTEVNTTF